MKDIGKTLRNHRKSLKLSQGDVQRKLRFYGYKLGKTAISSWETDVNLPNAEQFLAMCELYGIGNINQAFLNDAAPDMADPFANLNAEGRAKALDYIRLLEKSGEYAVETDGAGITRELPKYDISVSAGTGNFLDSDNFEMIPVGPDAPADADFIVAIHGDSMEPLFTDKQLVYVKKTQALSDGDIGIFFLNGDAYCKKLHETKDELKLISLNQKYAPIDITESSSFHVFGKVVL